MKRLLLASAAAVVSISANPAWAQTAADDAAQDGDIVVTALRNETLLSKTPLAITAITGDDLRDQGIVGPTDLGESVPNLSIDRTNGLQITIRGVTSTDGTEKGNPSAAFYIDDIYMARPQEADIGFFDVQRVEVLRGPQGTLFGRNSTAGLVNVHTNKPDPGAFAAGMNAGYGNYNAANVDGFVNMPIGTTAAFRLAATYDRRDNYVNPMAGDTVSNLNTTPFRENFAVRGSLKFDLGEQGDVLLRGNYGHLGGTRATAVPTSNFYRQSGRGTNITDANGNAIWLPISQDNDVLFTRNLRAIAINPAWGGGTGNSNAQQVDNTTWSIDGELNYDFGGAKLTYLGSYREYTAHENSQLDINGLLPAGLPGFLTTAHFQADCTEPTEYCTYPGFFDGDYQQQSHELRLSFGDGPLKFQTGGYYFREHSIIGFWIPDFPEFIIGNNKFYGFPQETVNKTLGAFAEGTFSVSDSLRLTAGVRYTHDDLFRYGHTVATNSITAPIVIGGSTYANDAEVIGKRVTWNAGFDMDVGRALLYGSVKSGYKQGGFGDGCSTGATTHVTSRGESCAATLPQAIYYEPEQLTAYELGFRGPVMDGLRLDANLFYYDYKNMQLSSLLNINGAPTQVTTNAGKSRIYGLEFQATVNPVQNFQVDFGINLTNAKYQHFCPGGTVTGKPLDACSAGTQDYTGRSLDRSPSESAFMNLQYTVPVGAGEVVLSAGTRMTGKYSITQFGNPATQYFTPAHSNSSASITYNAPDNRFYISAFVKNIENFLEIRAATNDTVTPGDPRTFGVRAGFNF